MNDDSKQQERQSNQSTASTSSERQVYETGAQRSQRLPRYDLIYKRAVDRLAVRCTGSPETGGAHKYGEGNWQKGLPTSDTINHIIHHITKWQDTFRTALTNLINNGADPKYIMEHVQHVMQVSTENDDDLAGAMWGIMVLMYQEEHGMFHDDSFAIPHAVSVDYVAEPGDDPIDRMYGSIMNLSFDDFEKIAHYVATLQDMRKRQAAGILKEDPPNRRRKSDRKVKRHTRKVSHTKRTR